jgi:hypothetical protein
MASLYWKLGLIDSGVEHIRVKRRGLVIKEGSFYQGFAMHLTIGDSVFVKGPSGCWKLKYSICIHQNRPAIKFGKTIKGPKVKYLKENKENNNVNSRSKGVAVPSAD